MEPQMEQQSLPSESSSQSPSALQSVRSGGNDECFTAVEGLAAGEGTFVGLAVGGSGAIDGDLDESGHAASASISRARNLDISPA